MPRPQPLMAVGRGAGAAQYLVGDDPNCPDVDRRVVRDILIPIHPATLLELFVVTNHLRLRATIRE